MAGPETPRRAARGFVARYGRRRGGAAAGAARPAGGGGPGGAGARGRPAHLGRSGFLLPRFGSVFLALLLTVLWWDSHRLVALAVFAPCSCAPARSPPSRCTACRAGLASCSPQPGELRRDREALQPRIPIVNHRLMELAARKERLLMRSDCCAARWRRTCIAGSRIRGHRPVRDVGRWLRGHPKWWRGLVLLLVKRPRSLMRWARRAWVGWSFGAACARGPHRADHGVLSVAPFQGATRTGAACPAPPATAHIRKKSNQPRASTNQPALALMKVRGTAARLVNNASCVAV